MGTTWTGLRIQLITEFSNELVRSVMAGELNLTLVTAPQENSQITAVPFALTPLYAALPESHAAAQKEHVSLQDLTKDDWILFGATSPLRRSRCDRGHSTT
jgi:LysR family hydrogen peroxide-inducible transcriptional activator